MLTLKKLCFMSIVFISMSLKAQVSVLSQKVLRSTLSSAFVSHRSPNNFIAQQAVGQSSVIGDYQMGEALVSQGFFHARPIATPVHGRQIEQTQFEVYPNPFRKSISFSVSGYEGAIEIRVYNDLGHLVARTTDFTSNRMSLDLAHLPAGHYILSLCYGQFRKTEQLIKLI